MRSSIEQRKLGEGARNLLFIDFKKDVKSRYLMTNRY